MTHTEQIHTKHRYAYKREQVLQSEPTKIYYATDIETGEQSVLKILRPYEDDRYKLQTPLRRKSCQIRAYCYNKLFTPDVYKALGAVEAIYADEIVLADIFLNVSEARQEHIHYNEYALIMKYLEHNRRLDMVFRQLLAQPLEQQTTASLQEYATLLAHRIAHMHNKRLAPLPHGHRWGDPVALCKKLLHNENLLRNAVLEDSKKIQTLRQEVLELLQVIYGKIVHPPYLCYFKHRIEQGWIRHCHGDLKSTNIWIMPSQEEEKEEEQLMQSVKILDAIDFNKIYYNIDVLSDLAMLIVDIQAMIREVLAHHPSLSSIENIFLRRFIEEYLTRTGQVTGDETKFVLGYYCLEKAIVKAAIELPQNGAEIRRQALLELAADLLRTYFQPL